MWKTLIPIIVVLCLSVSGCAKKGIKSGGNAGAVLPNGKIQKTDGHGEAFSSEPAETISESIETSAIDTKPTDIGALFEDILFDFDRYEIRPDAVPVLNNLSDWLIANPSSSVQIEGHCDELGTDEYNLALGDGRAASARNYLISRGVPGKRISTISFGEAMPVCTEKTAECWMRNRRSHFVLGNAGTKNAELN